MESDFSRIGPKPGLRPRAGFISAWIHAAHKRKSPAEARRRELLRRLEAAARLWSRTRVGDSQGHVQAEWPRNTKPRHRRGRGFCKPSQVELQGGRQRHIGCRMQEQFTRSPRRRATVRQHGVLAVSFRSARSSTNTRRDWRFRIVEDLARAQPSPAVVGRSCQSTPRYRKRSWWLDTSTPAQSRRAVKRWYGHTQDLWRRNVRIAAWCALGSTQTHVGATYGLSRQRVGQIVREFEWVQEEVQERLQSLDDPDGGDGGKCQSSLRGEGGSGSSHLEGLERCSGEFRPLARPNRARWRQICDRRGAGSRRRPEGCPARPPSGPGRPARKARKVNKAALVAASLASAGGFPGPEPGGKVPVQPPPEGGGKCQFSPRRKGGESASSAPAGRGGKVPVSLAEITRRWRLRGGAVWRQRRFPILARPEAPVLAATGKYQGQGRLW